MRPDVVAIGLFVVGLIWLSTVAFWPERNPRLSKTPVDAPKVIINYDKTTLTERTIALRNDLLTFLDELGPEPSIGSRETQVTWIEHRKQTTIRNQKVHHGFELRFAERLKLIVHELGEQNKLPMGLDLSFREEPKTDKVLRGVIDGLTNAARILHD
jgi:hypothetical protein